MITFVDTANRIIVRLDGKTTGAIYNAPMKDQMGYQYVPMGTKDGGDVFPTLEACKKSLFTEA